MTNEEQEKLNGKLHYAVFSGKSVDEIKGLIEAGADINARDFVGRTALMYARTAEQTKFFLEMGAAIEVAIMKEVEPVEKGVQPRRRAVKEAEMVAVGKQSALMYVKTAEQAKLLIEAGADLNMQDDKGRGVLACYLERHSDFKDKVRFNGDVKVVKALLEAGVNMEGKCEIFDSIAECSYVMSVKKVLSEIDDPEIRNTICSTVRDPECIRKHIEERKENIKKSHQLRKCLKKQNPTEKVSGVVLADEIARDVISGKEKRTITPGVGVEIRRKKAMEK